MHLTPAKLSSYISDPLHEVKVISLKNLEINHVEDISCCVNLQRLDLSNNKLSQGEQLMGIQYVESLSFLKLADNQLSELDFIPKLRKLITLNLSNNNFTRIPQHLSNCTLLKALILNNNQIKSIDNIGTLTELNTLILSHNEISTPPNLEKNKNLTKLSLAHNDLREFPPLKNMFELKELRLNNNKITHIPQELRYCPALTTLNLSNNLISKFEDVEVLEDMIHIKELSLSGNPIAAIEGYQEKIKSLLPLLRILDNVRFDPKFIERKERLKQKLENEAKAENKEDLTKNDDSPKVISNQNSPNKKFVKRVDHKDSYAPDSKKARSEDRPRKDVNFKSGKFNGTKSFPAKKNFKTVSRTSGRQHSTGKPNNSKRIDKKSNSSVKPKSQANKAVASSSGDPFFNI